MSVTRLIAVFLLAAGLVAAIAAAGRASAQTTATRAKEVGCKTLVRSVQETGEAPRVVVNSKNGMVRVEATIGYCFEPIAQWSARKWEKKIAPVAVDRPPAGQEALQEAMRPPALAPETGTPRGPGFPRRRPSSRRCPGPAAPATHG